MEQLAKEIHYEPLPGEVRAVIIAAWQRGGLLPAAAIEQMVPPQVQAASATPVERPERAGLAHLYFFAAVTFNASISRSFPA
jgi:hypothetical protein